MTRRTFSPKLHFSSWKVMISLVMAVIMFFSLPLHSAAASHADGDLYFGLAVQNPRMILNFFGNYTEEGSDRDSSIPYVFSGSNYAYLNVSNVNAAPENKYPYVHGVITKRLTFTLATQTTGLTLSSGPPRVTISDTSLPEGVTAYLSDLRGSSTSFTADLNLAFRNVLIGYSVRGGITLDFQTYGIASAHDFGSSYSFLGYSVSVSEDWSGNVRFGETAADFDPLIRHFYNNVTNQLNIQESIYSRLADMNKNITAQGTNITTKIQSQITNDNANTKKVTDKIQSQITNDDLNTKKITEKIHVQTQADFENTGLVLNTLNITSKNEIANNNKNADDIMNSYDDTNQSSDNDRFDSSQKQLQDTEDSLFGDASAAFDALDLSQYVIGSNSSVVAAMSFVSGFLQSLFQKMGVFGTIVTSGMVVLIVSKVIGLYRFSTDGGKGG